MKMLISKRWKHQERDPDILEECGGEGVTAGRVCLQCELMWRLQEQQEQEHAGRQVLDAEWATLGRLKSDMKRQNKADKGEWGRSLRYHCDLGALHGSS